jgi:hypothetical protein
LKDFNIFIDTKIKKAHIFKTSLIIIYFSNLSMYENNFWYLFDVKKLTLLNYDNLKKYYVNLEGFLKLDNFFDLNSIDLFSNLKVLQEILSKEKRQRQIYLILSRN